MAQCHAYARVAAKGEVDAGTLRGFYRPNDPRLGKIPAAELVELDQLQWETWLLKQESTWDHARGELVVREYTFPTPTAGEQVRFRIERTPELAALVEALASRLGITVDDLRTDIEAAAERRASS